jgi:hypothetical protein
LENLPPIVPDGFSGYVHRPGELVDEIAEAQLALEDLVGVEGMLLAPSDIQARLVDPAARQVVLDTARAIERVPELLGLSPASSFVRGRRLNEARIGWRCECCAQVPMLDPSKVSCPEHFSGA